MCENQKPLSQKELAQNSALVVITIATLAMIRKGNYRIALLFYSKSGGGGVNVYKKKDGTLQRQFAIDYHPFWDKSTKQSIWKLHYHRGKNVSQMKKHRPYEGGW